ncbi:SHOCT domain-containing protein [Archaeoglobus veneficus]|uniref:SHOCT domain-containing protein n=1 Tax=Archaeoglobus veneficus TaxID=58290 RepID=UPI000A048CFC|nr:SHOCT domain-containing protein [Archaeoglobus veneficus]
MTQVIEKTPAQKVNKEDPIEKLKKLKELYDLGILSEEEYQRKRKELLEML